ncbi:MAG: cation diffusion facilitator family transporter [Candidatus Omnitrophota bacterium]
MLKDHEKYMLRATLVSLFCNIILVLIKVASLLIVNSLAIAMDLGISFVGLAVSIILYYSIKLANRPADLIHNYGYGKVEHVCEAMEGVVLIGIALAMSLQALSHFLHPKPISMPWIGLFTSFINSAINFAGAYYIFKMAAKSASPAINAEGVHYRMEGLISGMIGISFVISIALVSRGRADIAVYIDPVAAVLVSGILIIPSFHLAKNSFFKLLDSSVEEDSQIEILKQLSRHSDKYCEFQDLKTRSSGRNKFIEFKLIVPEDISFKNGHHIVSGLEHDIRKSIQNCDVLIKMEPCKKDCEYSKKNSACPYFMK